MKDRGSALMPKLAGRVIEDQAVRLVKDDASPGEKRKQWEYGRRLRFDVALG